jgi:AcrR family transcriptional regulator
VKVLQLAMPEAMHPTKIKLVETTAKLLRTIDRSQVTSEMILQESGISKGSLYHHFADLEDLIEAAIIQRYARWVDTSIDGMTQLLNSAKSADDIFLGLKEVTRRTQSDDFFPERQNRINVLARANTSERFAKLLGEEQQRLTDALTDLVVKAQERNFYSKDIDARAIAVFIQAYTVGKIVDDFNENKVDPDAWIDLINTVIKKVFIK